MTGAVPVPEGMVKPADDASSREGKEERWWKYSHLPCKGWRGVAATVLAKKRWAKCIVRGLQCDRLGRLKDECRM